ncbi:MAG: hypothetical protein IJX51_04405 [Clostridia bacterium]|nr:hypothetical protein [Clostridia bacterium]
MSKNVLDKDKINRDLNTLIVKAIPKILLNGIICAITTSVYVTLIKNLIKFLNPEENNDKIIAISVLLGIVFILFPLYRFIYGAYLAISLKVKISKSGYKISEDELAQRHGNESVGIKASLTLTPSIKSYHWVRNATYLKSHGRYIITSSEDDGYLGYASGDSRVYAVLVKGIKEPMLVYTQMMYVYREETKE